MKAVRGVQFTDNVASVVQSLVVRIEEFAGKDRLYHQYTGICFALRTPEQSHAAKRKAAFRIFAVLKPTKDGAELVRPRVPRSEPSRSRITQGNLEELVSLVKTWYGEVSDSPKPMEKQSTEKPLVLAGGQFESKRAKH